MRRAASVLLLALIAASTSAVPREASVSITQSAAVAPQTERRYLSGEHADEPRTWPFRVSEGRRAGEWAEIPVPSHWEQHGFGRYAYGHDEHTSDEVGLYRTTFEVPEAWRERRVRLVFEGVMTDTRPTLNGVVLRTHRGGFTPFSYDVTRLVRIGAANELEVRVAERSANASVNAAERGADYWVFGGIYRPVYLEATPRAAIVGLAVDARHDGRLELHVRTRGAPPRSRVHVVVREQNGTALGSAGSEPLRAEIGASGTVTFAARFEEVVPWSAESPHLYEVEATLESAAGEPLHRVVERIGFRTVEVRLGGSPGSPPGLYVNGLRTVLRGVDRHSFWPDTGRAGSPRRNRADVEVIRALHLDAVRASHYPPDRSFLDACDELGLFVIDELPGWHDAYDAAVGGALVRAMVRRDRNHPSVILWANGNEGGWNRRLDSAFAAHDPQRRPVLHPDTTFGGFDTKHYPGFEALVAKLRAPSRAGSPLVMPTEWLHGLYDGGGGAGLRAQWEALRAAPRGAGGFLWSFADEAVARSDQNGALDHHGNFAPDGILGPWREETGSAAAVRDVFAPIQLRAWSTGAAEGAATADVELAADAALRVQVENRTHALDLDAFEIEWRILRFSGPEGSESPLVLHSGTAAVPPSAPGETAWIELAPRGMDRPSADDPLGADALEVRVVRRGSVEGAAAEGAAAAAHWVVPFPPTRNRRVAAGSDGDLPAGAAPLLPRDGVYELRGGGTTALFDAETGSLISIERDGARLPLRGGAVAIGDAAAPVRELRALRSAAGDELLVRGSGALREARWSIDPDGWLRLRFELEDAAGAAAGIGFDGLPWHAVRRVEWLGGGPYRVWGNRLEGARFGRWGFDRLDPGPRPWLAVELAGARAGVRWARLVLDGGELLVAPALDEPPGHEALAAGSAPTATLGAPFLWLSSPPFPSDARTAVAELPRGLDSESSLAVLLRVPPIGTKFHAARDVSPPPRATQEPITGEVALRFFPAPVSSAPESPAAFR